MSRTAAPKANSTVAEGEGTPMSPNARPVRGPSRALSEPLGILGGH
jgi:hypothetical protein